MKEDREGMLIAIILVKTRGGKTRKKKETEMEEGKKIVKREKKDWKRVMRTSLMKTSASVANEI